jgi:hypothetical protein
MHESESTNGPPNLAIMLASHFFPLSLQFIHVFRYRTKIQVGWCVSVNYAEHRGPRKLRSEIRKVVQVPSSPPTSRPWVTSMLVFDSEAQTWKMKLREERSS